MLSELGTYSSNITNMKKYIENFIKRIVEDVVESKVKRIAYECSKEITHNQFAYIGIQRLYKALDEISKSNEKYVALGELYSRIVRDNLARENGEIIHNYFELQPKLNQYAQSIEKLVEESQL